MNQSPGPPESLGRGRANYPRGPQIKFISNASQFSRDLRLSQVCNDYSPALVNLAAYYNDRVFIPNPMDITPYARYSTIINQTDIV